MKTWPSTLRLSILTMPTQGAGAWHGRKNLRQILNFCLTRLKLPNKTPWAGRLTQPKLHSSQFWRPWETRGCQQGRFYNGASSAGVWTANILPRAHVASSVHRREQALWWLFSQGLWSHSERPPSRPPLTLVTPSSDTTMLGLTASTSEFWEDTNIQSLRSC